MRPIWVDEEGNLDLRATEARHSYYASIAKFWWGALAGLLFGLLVCSLF